MSEKGRKAFLRKNKDMAINGAGNGKYYLPKGKYNLVMNGVKKSFEVK